MLTRKIVYIDLSKGTIVQQDLPLELRRKYLGGRGINAHLLYQLAKPPYEPLAPNNPLLIGNGLLTGVPGFGTSRVDISALSPLSGNLGSSNIGGHFGPELKYAGFDHLVITGRSNVPVYILATNDKLEIRDARHLWGKDTLETQELIKSENKDDRVRAIVIGPAGEKLVRMACVITGPKDAAGRYGMGAVMGSKNLKAVAARGTKEVSLCHAKELLTYVKQEIDNKILASKNVQALRRFGTAMMLKLWNERNYLYPRYGAAPPLGKRAEPIYADNLERYSLGMASCFGCAVHCRHRHLIRHGRFAGTRGEGPEWAAIGNLGAFIENVTDIESIIYASDLCNRFGLSISDVGWMVAFTMDMYQQGIIGKDEIGKSAEWGDPEAVLSLIVDIAERRGFGDILAEGPYALRKLPPESAACLPLIKNALPLSGQRVVKSWAFSEMTSTIPGHQHRGDSGIDAMGLPAKVLEKLYGGYISSDFRSYEGKALMVWWHQLLYAICDSLGCCRMQVAFNSPHLPKYEEYSELIRLSTGLDISVAELKEIGERIYTTERLILGKLGVGSREHDTLPESFFIQPMMGDTPVGEFIDREKFNQLLDEFYALHGWDSGGIPTKKTVERLGIR